MPLYPFACDRCGLEFDVSRQADDRERPAECPLDGSQAHVSDTSKPMQRADGTSIGRRGVPAWSAFMHDHGPGTMPHPHTAGTPFHRR